MILRKPYAFLIKHFKLIHIILTVLMYLFLQKMFTITEFLNEYISRGTYRQETGIVSKYIGLWGFLLPIVIITIILVIIYLLKLKQKPIKYYICTILVYVIEIIMLAVAYYLFTTIQLGEAEATFTEVFRDLFGTLSYLTIPFMVVSLIRSVGFNIKQFNFKKDLMDLNIVDEDNEEFEVELEVDTEDLKAKINRKFRFIKYVYLENKLAFIIMAIILVLGISFGIYKLTTNGEKVYSENEIFYAYQLELKIDNSYKTKYACDGSIIKKNKFYVIVSINVKSNLEQNTVLPYENIYLRVSEDTRYAPTDSYKEELADFGNRYVSNSVIKPLENKTVNLVYEVDEKYIDNAFTIEYLTNRTIKDNIAEYQYTKLSLNPKEHNEIKKVSEKELGEVLTFEDSLIEGTEIKIDEVEFNDRFSYKYKIDASEKEYTKIIYPKDESSFKKTIMRLKVNLVKNSDLNKNIYSSIYENFATIEYELNGKMIKQKTKIIDLTPNNSEYVYLELLSNVSASKKVYLLFTVRNKEYRYLVVNKE